MFTETADYSTNPIALKAGTLIGEQERKDGGRLLRLQGNQAMVPVPELYEVELKEGVWYNFGVVMDFEKK